MLLFDRKVLTMALPQVAFICSCVLLVPLAVMQVIMRRQVQNAKYGIGSPEISPWAVRFANEMFGSHGIWNAHKRAYERSALRSAFVVVSAAWLAFVLLALVAFLVGKLR
jgi:hypothetical protein